MLDDDSLIKCLGLLIIWLYPAVVVILSSSKPAMLSLSVGHHFKHFALISPMATKQAGCWSFILERRESRLEQKLSSTLWTYRGM